MSFSRGSMVQKSYLLALAAFLLPLLPLRGGPVINEFMAANDSIYPDNSDFDDYSDWIELANPDATAVVLTNYYLTDDLSQPFKWTIPAGLTVPAGGYVVIRADGFDAAPGETHDRIYWPWISTFTTKWYHTGFKLSAGGEAVGLFRSLAPPQDVTLIPAGSTWKYRDAGTDPGTNWANLDYDDASWPEGPAQLGYGDGDEATVISYGGNASAKFPSAQFRTRFNVTDPERLGNIRLRIVADDGVILYLNGSEFARVRLPSTPITYTNYALAQPPAENAFESLELPRSLLRAGENVLAAEVHQIRADSSDLSWNAELIVSEISGDPILVDSVTFGAQTSDVSFGRNATNGWSFFGSPTPGGPNTTEPLTELAAAPAVTASTASGFYADSVSVSLQSAGTVTSIRYTLDGSVPGVDSAAYSNSISITANTTLRARAFVTGRIPGPVLTRTFFINEPGDRTLPVASFVADPATLFGGLTGIYSNNTPYPYKGREIPARLEFFETNGAAAFAVNCGIRIGGENIWRFAQKPLNVHMRGKYGDDLIPYQVFPGELGATFGELNFRNGGDNWAKDMLRDAMMAPVLAGQTENDLSSYRPCVVFINGVYWGIHDIRKQFDPVYFANEHQLSADTYDLVQYAHNEVGVTELTADTGNIDSYEVFHAFYTTHDLAVPSNYLSLQAQMNVDSFIDYVAAEDFGVNTSWSHNREFWRARAAGSKWQWNVPDFDRCFDPGNVTGSIIDDFRNSYPLFEALSHNTNFVNRLLQRYAAHLGSTLSSNRVSSILDQLASEVDGEMPRHISRWAAEGGIPSLASRQAQLEAIKQFLINRPQYAVSRLQTELGVSRGLANLALAASPPAGGNLRVAGVPLTPEFNMTIGLFKNTPVELTAEPAPGYSFAGWSDGDTNSTIQRVLTGDDSLTAIFVPGAETVLPDVISANTTLSLAGSPYTATNDVVVSSNATVTIEPGVTVLMPPRRSFYIHGAMQVNGTSNAPVQFLARSGQPWGNLSFVNAEGNSWLSNVIIRNTSPSRRDPANLKAAVSAYNSSVAIDGADIEANLPVFARFGSIVLRNSRIHVLFTGDGINVKSGAAIVENCVFTGNPTPDTDAIDYDNVTNGLIRANRIYAFRGDNSDGIDVGEGCQNLLVVSNRIFNMFDKAVSVGQASDVRIERNLMVNCGIGVGVKDQNSTAYIDQNTLARNDVGVAVYEKNLGHGGGIAYVTNCVFSRSKDADVTVDSLSILIVSYSLSDTLPLPGANNLLADPAFSDAGNYDFSLKSVSPAIDAGDPLHALDSDGTRADMGAYYVYDPADYPFVVPNLVVINEVLAHSHNELADWIELHNNSSRDVNIGGWFLSDDPDTPLKYRIADGTVLPAEGYLVFFQDQNFGVTNGSDPGAVIPFALSENGETVNLFGPSDGMRPDYTEKETFGPSSRGISIGRCYKASTRTYNFVAMESPTPGAANSAPLTGPVVISEIMYHPPVSDAEYIELTNIETNQVPLFDAEAGEPWRLTRGITHVFPSAPPLVLQPGEKILLVRDSAAFAAAYAPPPGTRVFQWDSGALDNGGETIELSLPGDVDNYGVRQFIREDRVDYSTKAPWPMGPDGSGTSLVRINERSYGNDVANWAESQPTPGTTGYQEWLASQNLPEGQSDLLSDPDGDRISNALEYALGTDPKTPSQIAFKVQMEPGGIRLTLSLPTIRPDATYLIQKASNNGLTAWTNLAADRVAMPGGGAAVTALDGNHTQSGFYRIDVILFNQ